MKIVLIIYAISWLILGIMFIVSRRRKSQSLKDLTDEGWIVYALFIGLAPILVLLIPFILINDSIKENKIKKNRVQTGKESLNTANTVVEQLPDDIYHNVAKLLIQCRSSQNFDSLRPFLSNDVRLVIYGLKTMHGIDEFINYWVDKEKRMKNDNVEIEPSLRICNYNSRVSVFDRIKGYKDMFVLFRIVDGKITHVIYTPEVLQRIVVSNKGINRLPFSYDYILSHSSDILTPQKDKFFCMKCGEQSENLEWRKVYLEFGARAYSGYATICKKCKKVVEYYPETRLSLERDNIKEVDEKPNVPDFVIPNLSIASFNFSNPLKGSNYFDRLDKAKIIHHKDEYLARQFSSIEELQPCSLLDVAEQFNVFMLRSLKETNPDIFETIIESYEQAIQDGIYEAANNLGVFAYNYENDRNKGMKLLHLAADNGSKDAMGNIFTVLWSEKEYQQAYEYLEEMCKKEDAPSNVLRNLATLYIRGSFIEHNPVNFNLQKGKSLLERIVQKQPVDKDCERILKESESILSQIKSNDTNQYGIVGFELHRFLKRESGMERPSDYDFQQSLQRYLNQLRFDDKIYMHLAEENYESSGDESWFFTANDSKGSFRDSEYLSRHTQASPSEISAWQAYLLLTSNHILPVFWHGGYNVRQFIFAKSDITRIKSFNGNDLFADYDLSNIINNFDLLPRVELNGDKAIVSCCYWNLWQGLVRESYEIVFGDSGKFSISNEKSSMVIYEYHCGIWF